MVGSLEFRRTDPNRKGRGAGQYYHRGNGVYSKYNENRDGELWHKRKKTKNVPEREREQPHKADYKTKSTKNRSVITKRVAKGRVQGYF